MSLYFNTSARIVDLQRVAESWVGTPFFPNVAIRGVGVSCQFLVGAILIECGALPSDFVIGKGPMQWARAHRDSLICPVLDATPQLQTIFDRSAEGGSASPPQGCDAGRSIISATAPGDVLGLRWGGCVQHLAIVLDSFRALHVLEGHKVEPLSLTDARTISHTDRIWRPVEA